VRRRPRAGIGAAAAALLLVAGACNRADGADRMDGKLTVFAASSLTEAFTELGRTFEDEHPDVEVTFNFAGSSALVQQLDSGAPADVFASADEANMQKAVTAGDAADPVVIARNRLALLVERGNPKGITSLADLDKTGIVFVLCAPEVPCGKFGAAALATARVTAGPASLEENVKAVVSKVVLGEADAGIVYATDVQAAGTQADGIAIDGAPEAVYPIAVTTAATNRDAAEAWIALVRSKEGRAVLAARGFLEPTS
jgi:molybdate transport system substrate-binding protein